MERAKKKKAATAPQRTVTATRLSSSCLTKVMDELSSLFNAVKT